MKPSVIVIVLLIVCADHAHTKERLDDTVLGKPSSQKASTHMSRSGFSQMKVRPLRRFASTVLANHLLIRKSGASSSGLASITHAHPASGTLMNGVTKWPGSNRIVNFLNRAMGDQTVLRSSGISRSSRGIGDSDSKQATQSREPPKPSKALRLSTGFALLAHPEKAEKGGEDAFFVSENGCVLGIADGVGGWSELGVDPGLYSKLLMQNAKVAADEMQDYNKTTPFQIMQIAHNKTDIQGSSTACVLVLQNDKLHAANVGDSGFLVIREGSMIFQSPSQQHEFNYPFQLGGPESMSDTPDAADTFTIEVLPGDIIVTGSDGLWDNVYTDDIVRLVQMSREEGKGPKKISSRLASYARKRGEDERYLSPFAHAALSLGAWYTGGKLDDIVVTVSLVDNETVTVEGM
eukprot:gnl/MRDRNA2_/MRDRNA2_92459_c0_seq1.p1 gnl/MRDRNA2_/MRDRNA2_92459_c0~~gnl/MRDRNA2_/MRDRNA2_92459_c0_seq1.p1  ORF type:complete len:406 (+),score=61.04 gnl/MRDRNA2_/MRDRNA2_92459_c0_seq1:107-1324(+)